jgi:uncharacterized protein (DUF342 family)
VPRLHNNQVMGEQAAVSLKGKLELQVDQAGLEARLEFSPDPQGPEWDRQSAYALLEKRGIKERIDTKALDSLFGQEKPQARSLIVARGTAAQPGVPASLTVERLEIPEALQPYQQQVIPADSTPQVFRRSVEKIRIEKPVRRKRRLAFLPARTEKEAVWERREIREPIERAGPEQGRGYAGKGEVVAAVTLAERARAGRSVHGEEIPAEQPEDRGLFLSEGLKQVGSEVRSETAGFYRYGSNWIELFPFRLHEHQVSASPDGTTCLLSFTPGSDQAAPPTAEEVLEACRRLGFAPETLLSEEEAALILSKALTEKVPLESKPLSRPEDAEIRLEISEDKLEARLFLRKGRGEGRPLRLKEVSEAIRSRKLKGLDSARIREDILAFYRGRESSLEGCLLVEGREPQKGEDGRIKWKVAFLPSEQTEALKEQALSRPQQLGEIGSLAELPLEEVEQIAEVGERAAVAVVHGATAGTPGVDVFGVTLAGIKGRDVDIELFENLQRVGNEIVSLAAGVLEKGGRNETVLLRIRRHRDGEIQVTASEDRMQAFLTLLPAKGTGRPLDTEQVEQAIAAAGVKKGLMTEAVREAAARAQGGERVERALIARGQSPEHGRDSDIEILMQIASGRPVTIDEAGRAEYRLQDKITRVASGTLIARQGAPTSGTAGWDIYGKTIPARRGSARYVHVGKHVECRQKEDGSLEYYAASDGELDYRGGSLDVLKVHTVKGNVGLESGNVRFPGTVRVQGSVRSGFSVFSEESVLVEESIQGALLSAGESILVGKGIVGEGKAVLRARKGIRARFAEQATLLAVEDIRLSSACLRCTVKCNGNMILESEKGNIIGGRVYCKLNLTAMNIGSEREVPTEIFFGQDILVQDQLEREQRQAEILKARNSEIEVSMSRLERQSGPDLQAVEKLRAEKRHNLRLLQMHSKRIFILQERFEQHFPSEIAVRGVVYPGVILNSHSRRREIKTALREVVFYFNTTTGRIEEKALSE